MVAEDVLTPPLGAAGPSPIPSAAAASRRGAGLGGVLGLLPFAAYVLVFLGLPLVMVVQGALSDATTGAFTLHNISQSLSLPQYRDAFRGSLELSLWTALAGAVFGTWLAHAVVTARPDSLLRRLVSTGSGVLAYFAGVPLAFAFIAALGQAGVATLLLNDAGLDIYAHGFRIDSLTGVGLAYVYFQVPLMVILVTPALEGLQPQWREAAQGLGASSWAYWRHIGIPTLAPAVIGATLVLFGNAFAAFATALALVQGTLPLVPSQIQTALAGNVFVGQDHVGLALGVDMIVVIGLVMAGYAILQRKATRWLP
jgi:putative spermidine/putrescine transport system permease protein